MSQPTWWVRTEYAPQLDHTDLLDLIPPHTTSFTWLRNGEGLIGWGVMHQISTQGAHRFTQASKQWRQFVAAAQIHDDVRSPGSGLTAFGSFAFSRHSSRSSTLNVPKIIIGRRDSKTWVTRIDSQPVNLGFSDAFQPPASQEATGTGTEASTGAGQIVRTEPGTLSAEQWQTAVQHVIEQIKSGEVHKVVMAREEFATSDQPFDVLQALRRLAATYTSCWTFQVDGMLGATPELLIRKEKGLLASRVLAGTVKRSGHDREDSARALELAHDSKERSEHQYAVKSLIDSLASAVASTVVPDEPFVLRLPNVMHLATDVSAVLTPTSAHLGSLDIAAMAHPTAAVCGTPTLLAAEVLAEHEGFDRGRYAAPVGWLNADGDGEWGIALRCGEIMEPGKIRLFAGCGIMAASDPATEFAETEHKFAPMRAALGMTSQP